MFMKYFLKKKKFLLINIMVFLLFNCEYSKKINLKENENSKEVILKGKITTKEFYGPPNYGENPDTDIKESFYFLILHKPILIEINDTINNISEFQMIFVNRNQKIINTQEEYILKGNLFLAETGHHHSKVLILVKEFKMVGTRE
jgi:hypothetical protein